jgi:hypothetical protein
VQLNTAGANGEGVRGEVALAHRRAATVQAAAEDLAAVRVVRPAFARRHRVAVCVQGDDRAETVAATNDQVGDRLQAALAHDPFRHRVSFGIEAKRLEQFSRALRMRGVVARRRVGRHPDQRPQELHLLVEMRIDPAVELCMVRCCRRRAGRCHGLSRLDAGRGRHGGIARVGLPAAASARARRRPLKEWSRCAADSSCRRCRTAARR